MVGEFDLTTPTSSSRMKEKVRRWVRQLQYVAWSGGKVTGASGMESEINNVPGLISVKELASTTQLREAVWESISTLPDGGLKEELTSNFDAHFRKLKRYWTFV